CARRYWDWYFDVW
nr:immunoglobulin heavy chain junction region [Mus musculus]